MDDYGNRLSLIFEIKSILLKEFDMIDEGPIHYCIGNQITRNGTKGWIFLSLSKYLTRSLTML